MADKKISDLTSAGSIADADLFEIETSGGNSRKVTGTTLKTYAQTGISVNTGERAPVVPASADYTLQNAGSNASVSTVANGMLLSQPTGTSAAGIRFAKNTAGPASLTAFTLTVRCKVVGIATNNSYPCSIVLRETTGGKVLIFSIAYLRGTQYLVQRWSSYTSFSANAIAPAAFQGTVAFPWMRITVGSGTITFYLSPDGVNWTSVGTESVTTFLGAIDEVGVGCYIAGNLEDASTIFQSIELA